MTKIENNWDEVLLLRNFNDRDECAFGEVYSLFYRDTACYASMLYRTTKVQPSDVIHDIFIKLWQSPHVKFDSLLKIKAYVYVSVKNDFKDYISHNKYVEKYKEMTLADQNFQTDMIENEAYALIDSSLDLLPSECAKIMRMFLEGYKPVEIAQKLGCTQQYVYNSKYESISLLKKKFLNNKVLIMILLNLMK